jgi:hypothetical protein
MNKRELVHSVLLSIGYVLLFISIAYKASFITEKYAIIILLAGIVILYFRKELANKIPIKIANMVIVQTIGLIFIFLGFERYMRQYLDKLWPIYIIAGALIFNYSAKIAKAVASDEPDEYPPVNVA